MSDTRKIVKELVQTGVRGSLKRDRSRGAKLPGKRISRTGLVYWETRRNRSDSRGRKI